MDRISFLRGSAVVVAAAQIKVAVEAPDGQVHGSAAIVASADACRVRPQDCAPLLRSILFPTTIAAKS